MQKVVSAANPNAVVKGTSSDTAQTLVELGAVIAIDNSLGSGGGSIRQATFATATSPPPPPKSKTSSQAISRLSGSTGVRRKVSRT
jgi:hypothetical protein